MSSKTIILGKYGYIASALREWFCTGGIDHVALASSDCNLEDRGATAQCLAHFGNDPLLVVCTSGICRDRDDSKASFERNICMAENLASTLNDSNTQHLVFLSTTDIYGMCESDVITEDSAVATDNWYGISKLVSERLLLGINRPSFPVTVLRLPGIYGPAKSDRSVIGKFVQEILSGHPITLHGGGRNLRDYVHVMDLARIIHRVGQLRHQGILNVATGESLSLKTIVSEIEIALDLEANVIESQTSSKRSFDLVFDNSLLLKSLNGFNFLSLKEGIETYQVPIS